MKILDVGGAIKTYEKATHIIDLVSKPEGCKREYIKFDVCSGKWPFEDKEFDFVYCSNLLEDVRDPIFVCKEMMRVSKAGRVIVPSVLTECTIGVDSWHNSNNYAGYCHHRWLCNSYEGGLQFIPKWDIVTAFDWTFHISEQEKKDLFYTHFDWEDSFHIEEVPYLSWKNYYDFLSKYFKTDPLKAIEEKKK